MTTITLVKDLPNSTNYYTGGGDDTTLTLQVIEFTMNSKKSLIKIQKPRSKSRQAANPTDQPDNKVVDLQRLEETMVVRAWLEDDATESAWNKAWKLRAMCSLGGPLKSFTIGEAGDSSPPKIAFGPGTVQDAFLEEVTFIVKPDDTGAITSPNPNYPARIEVSLSIYFGDER